MSRVMKSLPFLEFVLFFKFGLVEVGTKFGVRIE